jgi:transposase-like protein
VRPGAAADHVTAITVDERCPDCDQADGIRWTGNTPDTDAWSCTGCGAQWTITVDVPGAGPTVPPVVADLPREGAP